MQLIFERLRHLLGMRLSGEILLFELGAHLADRFLQLPDLLTGGLFLRLQTSLTFQMLRLEGIAERVDGPLEIVDLQLQIVRITI